MKSCCSNIRYRTLVTAPVLSALVALMVFLGAPGKAEAQFHGASIAKQCVSPAFVGENSNCQIRVTNNDEWGDTVTVSSVTDTVDPGGTAEVHNLTAVESTSGSVTCAAGPALPCTLNALGAFIILRSDDHVIAATDPNPLADQALAVVRDNCDAVGTSGCNGNPNNLQFTAQTVIASCAVSFDKQISCEGGAAESYVDVGQPDFAEGCISTGGDIVVKWIAKNEGTANATCTVEDDLAIVPAEEADFTLVGLGDEVIITSLAAACDAEEAGVNTGTLTCSCGENAPVLEPVIDQAEHGCCAIQLDKQVSCNDEAPVDVTDGDDAGGTNTRSCIALHAFGETPAGSIDISWIPGSLGTSDNVVLENCTLGETNAHALTGSAVSSVGVASDFSDVPSYSGTCSDAALLLGETGGENTATLKCDCALETEGNEEVAEALEAADTAGFECQTPGLEITKVCEVPGGETAEVAVTVTNTGDVQLIECEVTDALDDDDQCNGPYNTNVPLNSEGGVIPADFDLNATGLGGDSQDFTGSIGITETTCNQATVTCTIAGTETEISSTNTALCEANPPGCLTHTIGFWSNRSAFVDAVGPVSVCGQNLDQFGQIDDLLCSRGQDILHAQCAAAALNVRTSIVGDGTCAPSHTSNALGLLATCCGAPNDEGETCSGESVEGCIEEVSAFNESEDSLDCFELGPNANFCNPGRNGPNSCNGTKGPKGPGDDKPGKGPKK